MNDYIAESILSEDGNYRAQVILDQHSYDMRPDGDCYGTVLYQEGGYYRSSVSVWCQRWRGDDDMESAYSSVWDDLRDLDDVEAVLRGKANVCEECGAHLNSDDYKSERCPSAPDDEPDEECGHVDRYDFSDNPVVGFAVIELREGRLVNIVTLADLKVWGWETVKDFDAAMTSAGREGSDPSEHNLDDFEAYANGDVYLVTVERKVIETTVIKTLLQEVVRETTTETWEEHPDHATLHGFYSVETALEHANYSLSLIATELTDKKEIPA